MTYKRKTVTIVVIVTLALATIPSNLSAEPWNVTDSNQVGVLGGPETGANGIYVSPDGEHVFITTYSSNERIYHYELSEPWNISTANQVGFMSLSGVDDLWFEPDGSRMFVARGSIRSYDLSTPWDLSSRSFTGHQTSVAQGEALAFNEDGTVMYSDTSSDGFAQYPLTEAWNVSTAQSATHSIDNLSGDISAVSPGKNGEKFYAMGGGVTLREYNLTTPYDISTATFNRSGGPSGQGLHWKPDGSNFYTAEAGNYNQYSTFTATISGYVKDSSGDVLDNATVSNNVSSLTDTTDQNGFYEIPADDGTYELTASREDYQDNSTVVIVSGSNVNNANITLFEESDLELQINPYMKHGATQSYQVVQNQSGEITIVTNQASVTSSNSTVVAVDATENELVATSDKSVNARVVLSATFEGEQANQNVTVANRTISNIAIMPPSQRLAAVMGFDEGTWYVMGSEIQFVLLAIFIGAAAAWKARNEYLGIGTIILAIIIFWTADHVSLGIVMVAVFYGLFAAYQNRKTPSRSDTKVGEGLQQTTDRFRR